MKIGDVDIKWTGHAGFFITNSEKIYIDPYEIKDDSEKADLILITHSHYDHCSLIDIKKIIKEGTKIIFTPDCQSKITRIETPLKIQLIEPFQEINHKNIKIIGFPSYNINKPFHNKNESWIGFIIKTKDTIIYHAGDTDKIEEMQKLTGHKQEGKNFIALLPIGGRFTMNPEEAAEVAKLIKPTIAIPMHYGSIIGKKEDAEEFIELCKENGINAKILEKI